MESLAPSHSLTALADALEVSPSGLHAHRLKPSRPRRQQEATLRSLLRESFAASRHTYGAPRLLQELRARGFRCGKNRVARLMRLEKLRPRQKRRFRPQTTDSSRTSHPPENWLRKVPTPDRPGQIWQSDLTFIPTHEGWLYLAFTLDASSRRCLAHHCRDDLDASLATTTLQLALQRLHSSPHGLIHHSDRGSQYAARSFQNQLALCRITPSMSRRANPYDNALAESFVATLKTECFAGLIPASKAIARRMIFDYIESFYNPIRRHSSLRFLSPINFENLFFTSKPNP